MNLINVMWCGDERWDEMAYIVMKICNLRYGMWGKVVW